MKFERYLSGVELQLLATHWCQFLFIHLLLCRVVNGSVPVRVHGGPRTGTVKDKVELNPDPDPFWNRFLSSETETKTIYGTGLNPGPDLHR